MAGWNYRKQDRFLRTRLYRQCKNTSNPFKEQCVPATAGLSWTLAAEVSLMREKGSRARLEKDNCLRGYLWVPTVCQQSSHMPSGEMEKSTYMVG